MRAVIGLNLVLRKCQISEVSGLRQLDLHQGATLDPTVIAYRA